jgi:hypothetical protein
VGAFRKIWYFEVTFWHFFLTVRFIGSKKGFRNGHCAALHLHSRNANFCRYAALHQQEVSVGPNLAFLYGGHNLGRRATKT